MTTTGSDPGLHLRPMVHVADMATAIAFYQRLGAEIIHGGPDTDWVLMQLGAVQIGLIAHAPDACRDEGAVELTFSAAMALDELERRLHQAGFRAAEVTTDQTFGEQLQVRTPDGLLIKITQRESEE
ncbi:VOC family protein [Actinoplanes sp. TBRC 11911]|uniref:VOC family protein n=1 Tax=Actinoplanes sp. TBRC 11911 TaxID=2729386 RepID=UPI00145CA025|nr:VOC family protein [Actinoplanes sp. TBRC 11911]NMO50656.1 VOC family protein [Actinoplanes sp. TBRC 11911]